MPIEFQKIITIKLSFPVRQKPNGVFELRYRANGYNISVSSLDFNKLKPKFIKALQDYVQTKKQQEVPTMEQEKKTLPPFNVVAMQWLELRKPLIKAVTYEHYESLFRANVFPAFEGRTISDLKQSDCQELINRYLGLCKYRTADKIYQALKAIFEFAIGEELIEKSPMRFIKPPQYEEQGGVALTLNEERELLKLIAESKCDEVIKHSLIFLLYTGIRRSELADARIEDGFVSVLCAKTRKNYNEKRRLIPVTPMLAKWLPKFELDKMRTVRPDALTQAMKRLMPKHHLHELRHTFITRAQECGVPREVVSVWAGHAADNTQTSKVYTHFSNDFMRKEAQKVIYNLQ